MVNVFGESVGSGSGNLQIMKKVVVTKGKYKDYTNQIRQSYELGFIPYRLHKNAVCTFVTPIRVCDGEVYVLDDVATMKIGEWHIETDKISSKLVYFVEGDDGSGVALQGDRGPSGDKGLKGDSGDQGPAGKRGAVGPGGPPGKIGKMGPAGSKGDIGKRGEKGDKGDTGGVGQQGHIGPRGRTGPRGARC